MNKSEAKKAISLLKKGKNYKAGHYHYGYYHITYNSTKNEFLFKKEDLAMDMYNPEITESILTEEELMEMFTKNDSYDDFNDNLLKYCPPPTPRR